MILPITAYGNPVLRKVGVDIEKDYPDLDVLIQNMKETMANAQGVGLAAPQIGLPIRIFLVDATPFSDDEELSETEQVFLSSFKQTFINPTILEETGDEWAFNEGCLSIPDVREDVFRQPDIVIKYFDEEFKEKTEKFTGIAARIIQHEYDHIEGVLFTDKLTPLKKRVIKRRLTDISNGKTNIGYRMKYPNMKKKR